MASRVAEPLAPPGPRGRLDSPSLGARRVSGLGFGVEVLYPLGKGYLLPNKLTVVIGHTSKTHICKMPE